MCYNKITIQLKPEEILTELFHCDDVKELQDKLLILDGLDELCVLNHDFNGKLFLKKLSSLEYGYHVLVTSRESSSYFTEPNDEEGLKTERLIWKEKQIKDWLDLYKAKKPNKNDWCDNFYKQFISLEKNDKRREIFAVPIILYICGTSETDIEDHSSIGSIYRDAFTKILLRKHLKGQSNTDKFKKADKESNMIAWQFTKELAYQMFLNCTLDLVDDTSSNRQAVGFRNAQKRTKDILKEEFQIQEPNLELKKELAVCPFARENEKGGITFAHKTVYEYFTAVKLYEDYFAKFDTDYFNNTDENVAAKKVMESFIEAFRYDGIPDEVFSHLCEMKDAPFSNTLGYRDSKGLDYKKYEQKFVYAMQKHIYAVIEIKSAVKEYLYHKKNKFGTVDYKSIDIQTSTAFANFTCFLTFHGFKNEEKIPECMLIGNFMHNSLRSGLFIGWHFEGTNLHGADLRGAVFMNAHLENTNLECANLINSSLLNAHLTKSNLKGANMFKSVLENSDLTCADLAYTNLKRVYLNNSNLTDANLDSADLLFANLTRTNLYGANLKDANLQGAHLNKANLENTRLFRAYLEGAYLEYANLCNADLTVANLIGSDLIKANLSDVDLTVANLSDADLTGTNLKGAQLEGADLRGVKYCNDPEFKTIFPEGFNPEEHNMKEMNVLGEPVKDELIIFIAAIRLRYLANLRYFSRTVNRG